jgi:hypothetical protein
MELIEAKFIQKKGVFELNDLPKLDLSILTIGLLHLRKKNKILI